MTILRYPPPTAPWSVNGVPSSVRTKIELSRRKATWRGTTAMIARTTTRRVNRRHPPSTVQVTIPFSTARRRDPHNYTGTVVKSVIDGLVDAGFWPDDTAEFVTVLDPVLVVGDEVIVVVTPSAVHVHG